MAGYFLFRNQELVDKYCDPAGLGAGHLHNVGQEGDVLVYDGDVCLSAYRWYSDRPKKPTAWVRINLTDKQRKLYKALLLLYT